MDLMSFAFGVMSGVVLVFAFWCLSFLIAPWTRALFSGTSVPMMHVLGMRLRRTPASLVVGAYIQLRKQKFDTTLSEVETVFIAQRDKIHTADDLVYEVKAAADQPTQL